MGLILLFIAINEKPNKLATLLNINKVWRKKVTYTQCGKTANSLPREFFSSNQSTVKFLLVKR